MLVLRKVSLFSIGTMNFQGCLMLGLGLDFLTVSGVTNQ
jgi:hypothetical protein